MSKIYGYCRISTPRQSLQRQIDNIFRNYPQAELVAEVYTGMQSERPVWKKLLARIEPGDTIVFDSVSRMSRKADEGIRQYLRLYQNGVNLVFLKEPHINTEVYRQALQSNLMTMTGTDVDLILEGVNKYLIRLATRQIEIAFEQSEKEVADLRIRTIEGMKTSGAGEKIRQARTGRKFPSAKHMMQLLTILEDCKDFGGRKTDIRIAEGLSITRQSVFRDKREIQARMESEGMTVEEMHRILMQEYKQQKKIEEERQKKKKGRYTIPKMKG